MSPRRCLLYAIVPIAIAIAVLAVWGPHTLPPPAAPEQNNPRLLNRPPPAASKLSPDPAHPKRALSHREIGGH